MTRPTPRGAALLSVALAAYLAARVLGTWELYLVALAFAGMTAVAWALVTVASRRLSVDRRVTPDQPVAGDPLRFEFSVTSGWRLPGLHVVLSGAVAGAQGLPDPVVIEDMGLWRSRSVVAGPRPARRGAHRLPAFTATIEDPVGLVRRRTTVGEPLRITVPPRLEELASCAACARTGVRHGGGRRRLPTRSAWEFRSVRPHVRGEPLERVDWKSTAKTGTLMLREMEADTEDDLTVVLAAPPRKLGPTRHDPPEADEAFETAVVAAGSMAAFALGGGHAVSLLLPDDGGRDLHLTPDGAGRRRLLAALAETRPQDPQRLVSSLPAILSGRRSRHRVVALVTTRVDADLNVALEGLRHRGMVVSVVHVHADEPAGARVNGGGPADDAAALTAAAGARYFPVASAPELRGALADATSHRLMRTR
jgi:uncharacterized protein (DUF58 family)